MILYCVMCKSHKEHYVLNALVKRIILLFKSVLSEPGNQSRINFSEMNMSNSSITRKKLNELLEQTPSLPSYITKQPVKIS